MQKKLLFELKEMFIIPNNYKKVSNWFKKKQKKKKCMVLY